MALVMALGCRCQVPSFHPSWTQLIATNVENTDGSSAEYTKRVGFETVREFGATHSRLGGDGSPFFKEVARLCRKRNNWPTHRGTRVCLSG
jgi:hypothetical protein